MWAATPWAWGLWFQGHPRLPLLTPQPQPHQTGPCPPVFPTAHLGSSLHPHRPQTHLGAARAVAQVRQHLCGEGPQGMEGGAELCRLACPPHSLGPPGPPSPCLSPKACRRSPGAALRLGSCGPPAAVPLKQHPPPRQSPLPAILATLPAPQPHLPGRADKACGPHLHISVPASSSSGGDRQAPAARRSPMTPRCLPQERARSLSTSHPLF